MVAIIRRKFAAEKFKTQNLLWSKPDLKRFSQSKVMKLCFGSMILVLRFYLISRRRKAFDTLFSTEDSSYLHALMTKLTIQSIVEFSQLSYEGSHCSKVSFCGIYAIYFRQECMGNKWKHQSDVLRLRSTLSVTSSPTKTHGLLKIS